MFDKPPRIRGSSQSNSATEHMDTHKGVQEGTITPNTDGSPARSKNEKQLEMEGLRDFIQECAIEDEEWNWSPVLSPAQRFFVPFCIFASSLETYSRRMGFDSEVH
jgi:hypothetical protein